MQDRLFFPLVPIVESDAMVNKGEKNNTVHCISLG